MTTGSVDLGDQRCILRDTFAGLPTRDIKPGTPAKVGKDTYEFSQDGEWIRTSAGGAASVAKSTGNISTLLDAVTATGAGTAAELPAADATFQCIANGTSGAFSATVNVEVSNDNTNWETAITFSMSGTATTADTAGDNIAAPWKYIRGNVTAISGTGANVTLTMGY